MLNISSPRHNPLKNLIVLLIFACMFIEISPVKASSELNNSSQLIARVNGVPLYSDQIASAVEKRITQYQKLGSKLSADQLRKQFQLKELDGAIGYELLVQAGAALKPQDIETRLEKRLATHPSKDISTETKENLRREILKDVFLEQKGLLDLKVDEQQLLDFYEKNRKSFIEPRSVKAQHILIRLPQKPTAAQTMEARQKAEMILSELRKGKEFSEAARQYSECSTKETGGDLGIIKENYMPKEFDAVAFTLKPGETSGIVSTKQGLHIIRVGEKFPEKQLSFNEVKKHIAGYLQKDFQQRKINELIVELRRKAEINIYIQ